MDMEFEREDTIQCSGCLMGVYRYDKYKLICFCGYVIEEGDYFPDCWKEVPPDLGGINV